MIRPSSCIAALPCADTTCSHWQKRTHRPDAGPDTRQVLLAQEAVEHRVVRGSGQGCLSVEGAAAFSPLRAVGPASASPHTLQRLSQGPGAPAGGGVGRTLVSQSEPRLPAPSPGSAPGGTEGLQLGGGVSPSWGPA